MHSAGKGLLYIFKLNKMTQFISLSYLNGIHKSRTLHHILEHLCNIFIFIFNLLYIPFYKSPPTIKQNMLFFLIPRKVPKTEIKVAEMNALLSQYHTF